MLINMIPHKTECHLNLSLSPRLSETRGETGQTGVGGKRSWMQSGLKTSPDAGGVPEERDLKKDTQIF